VLNEEHRRLIRSSLGLLARALEPHPIPSAGPPAERPAPIEPPRVSPPPTIPAVAEPVRTEPAAAAPPRPEPIEPQIEPQLATPASRFFRELPWSARETVAPVAAAPRTALFEPVQADVSVPLAENPRRIEAETPAQSFFRDVPRSHRAEAKEALPEASAVPAPAPEPVPEAPRPLAGSYFQSVFQRQPAPVQVPSAARAGTGILVKEAARAEPAASYFGGLPWHPVAAPPPVGETEPPLGLGAAIMQAATRSALQSAERLAAAQRERPSVSATAYFGALPWRSAAAPEKP
jgi:hypothetical protein